MQRQPKNDQHCEQRQSDIELGILFDGSEFIVVDRNDAGLPHAHLVLTCQVEVRGNLRDCLRGGASRLQCREVEYRLDLKEAPQLARVELALVRQGAPGERRGPPGQHGFRCIGSLGHRRSGVIELDFPALHPHQHERQRVERAPQTRIRGQRAEQSIGTDQAIGCPLHLVGREKEQPVLLEELPAPGMANGAKPFRSRRKSVSELDRRLLDPFGSRAVEHDENVTLGEFIHVLLRSLRPGQVGRDEIANVGVNRKMPHGVSARPERQRQGKRDRPPGAPHAKLDETGDRRYRHIYIARAAVRFSPNPAAREIGA